MSFEEVHEAVQSVPLSSLADYLRAHGYHVQKQVPWDYYVMDERGVVHPRDQQRPAA